MIKRFNFYDVYVYLLPGIFLIALLWIPFGLTTGIWLPTDWGDAVAMTVVAYFIGHFLRAISEPAFPSTIRDPRGKSRARSDLILSSKDESKLLGGARFSDSLKEQISEKILTLFGINVAVGIAPNDILEKSLSSDDQELYRLLQKFPEDLSKLSESAADELIKWRNDAFFQCRSYLVIHKAATYTEQQEGMYALLRNTAAALCFASTFFLGWALADINGLGKWFGTDWHVWILTLPVLGAWLWSVVYLHLPGRPSAWKQFDQKLLFRLFTVSMLSVGIFAENLTPKNSKTIPVEMFILIMIAVALLGLCLSNICMGAYRYFANGFAATVYRDFNALRLPSP